MEQQLSKMLVCTIRLVTRNELQCRENALSQDRQIKIQYYVTLASIISDVILVFIFFIFLRRRYFPCISQKTIFPYISQKTIFPCISQKTIFPYISQKTIFPCISQKTIFPVHILEDDISRAYLRRRFSRAYYTTLAEPHF